MDGFTNFLSLIFFVFGVLNIILFFKIWGMTNDVSEIKNLLKKQYGYEDFKEEKSTETENNISVSASESINTPKDGDNKGSQNTSIIPVFIGAIILTILVLIIAFSLAR